jgi:hypothetical protein
MGPSIPGRPIRWQPLGSLARGSAVRVRPVRFARCRRGNGAPSAEVEDEFEGVVDGVHFLESEVVYLCAESSGVDRADHFAQDESRPLADGDLGVEARGRRRGRGLTHEDR